jgi:hypothetical protein
MNHARPFMTSMHTLLFCLVCALSGHGPAAAGEAACADPGPLRLDSITSRVVVIAEGAHGTNEAPALVTGLLCQAASLGRPVLLAWEFPSDKQEAINHYMQSDGAAAARRQLITSALTADDGRSSVAIFKMLESVRKWRAQGKRLAVSAVDAAETDLLLPLYPGEDRYKMWSNLTRQVVMATNVATRAWPEVAPGRRPANVQDRRHVHAECAGLDGADDDAVQRSGPRVPWAAGAHRSNGNERMGSPSLGCRCRATWKTR